MTTMQQLAYIFASFLGVCLLVLVICLIKTIYNISKNRIVKKKYTIRPNFMMLFCCIAMIFFGLVLFQIAVFDCRDNVAVFVELLLTSLFCLVDGAALAAIWKSWRITYDHKGFFFRDYDGKAKEYTYEDISDIRNGCIYVGDKKLTRVDNNYEEEKRFWKYAASHVSSARKERS